MAFARSWGSSTMDVEYVFERVLPLTEPIVPERGDRARGPEAR
jgi:hypothetical protein